MYSDIILAFITGFFIYFGTKFVNYYYNFYHIYRYLDSYQKLNYFKNISVINYLNKNIDIKKKIIYYFFIPLIKLNYLVISLFVSIVYSLCEEEFTDYLQKRNLVLTSDTINNSANLDIINPTNISNENNKDNKLESETKSSKYSQSELLINHDYLNTLNTLNVDSKKEKNSSDSGFGSRSRSRSEEINDHNYLMLNKYNTSTSSENSIGTNNIGKEKRKNNSKSIDNLESPEVNNQYQMDISNELDLLKPIKTNTIINDTNEQEDNENIDNYIVTNETKFKPIGIIGKNNNIIKPLNMDENIFNLNSNSNSNSNTNNIIETIRIDEIDFGDNLSNVLDSNILDKDNNKSKILDKKTREIKILPIKIGKKKN